MKKEKLPVNELTYEPGGYYITFEYKDGSTFRGINIKGIKRYIQTSITNSLLQGNEVIRVFLTKTREIIYENGKWYGFASK